MREPNAAIVHFYRASVMHADVWRRRLDATTNWAVVSTAALITFTFSSPSNPHFILLLALAFDAFFLFMESRRYQIFDLWRHRIRALNRWIMAPNISPRSAPVVEEIEEGLERLALGLSSTRPLLGIWHALGYRMRRNYMFVFTVVITTWLLKLWYHPVPAGEAATLISRATVGAVPGAMIMSAVFGFFAFGVVLTVRAPSEVMEDWAGLGSPIHRILNDKPVLKAMEPASDVFFEPLHKVRVEEAPVPDPKTGEPVPKTDPKTGESVPKTGESVPESGEAESDRDEVDPELATGEEERAEKEAAKA